MKTRNPKRFLEINPGRTLEVGEVLKDKGLPVGVIVSELDAGYYNVQVSGEYQGVDIADMFKRDEALNYWSSSKTDHNNPELYAKAQWRSDWLLELMKDIPKDVKICELGCGVSRNLNTLYKAGYKNIMGIEINKQSIDYGNEKYDVKWDIIYSPVEEVLNEMLYDVDCYISMAVLMHIHPDSEWIFEEMSKAEWIVCAEREYNEQNLIGEYIRDYQQVFKQHTMQKIDVCYLDSLDDPRVLFNKWKKENKLEGDQQYICKRQGLYTGRVLKK